MKQNQKFGAPMVRDITSSGFTIVTGAKDEISGIAKYECYINGVKKGESGTGTIEITGLSPKTSYDNIVVKVYNNAGLDEDTVPVSATTKDNLCYTSYCSGGSSYKCTNCNGTGTIARTSHGDWAYSSYAQDSEKTDRNHYCVMHMKFHGVGERFCRTYFVCGTCGAKYYATSCKPKKVTVSEFESYPEEYRIPWHRCFRNMFWANYLCELWWVGRSQNFVRTRVFVCTPILFTLCKYVRNFA